MGNNSCTTGSSATSYSRLRSAHYSHDDDDDDDHSLRDPLLRNITQRVEEQQQQLLHHIYEVTRVKETVKSANTSNSSSNPNPIPIPIPLSSQPMEQKPNNHHALEKELHRELRLGVAKPKILASCPSCYKQGEAIEKLKEKNANLEKKVMELRATIEEMKRTSASSINNNYYQKQNKKKSINNNIKIPAAGSTPQIIINTPIPDLINLQTPVAGTDNEIIEGVLGAEFEIKNDSSISELSSMTPVLPSEINYESLNDLTGCLVVLIFLVAVLIGVLL